MECVFCKIIKGEVPSLKVYETDSFFAFLDIRPIELGHTLIIPKDHHRWVWDTPNIGEYFGVVKKIANAQKKVLNIEMVKSIIILDQSKTKIPRGSRINRDKNNAEISRITKPIVKILKSKAANINFENPLISSKKFLCILQYIFLLPSNIINL